MQNTLHTQLFYPLDFECDKDGMRYSFSVKLRDIEGRPDCRLDDFYRNLWIRPNKALSFTWKGYKDEAQMQKSIKISLTRRGFKNIKLVISNR